METVTVNSDALRQVLNALNGPSHLIRELQVTRDKPPVFEGNPIDTLIREFNEAIEAWGKPEEPPNVKVSGSPTDERTTEN